MRRVLFIILVFIIFTINSLLAEPCVERISGRNGECLPFKNCKEKLDNFVRNNELPQVCNAKLQTICCPEEIEKTTTTIKPTNRISGKMCQEYGKLLFRNETFSNVLGQMITKTIEECGHIAHELFQHNNANSKEFPHMALIGYGEGYNVKYKGSGSLISEQWVLSAAHCSRDPELGDAKHIKLGGNERLKIEENAKIFSIEQIIKHPSYVVFNIEHDIVLFKMNEPATLDLYILPICLPQSNDIPSKVGIATGWSNTGHSNKMSAVLLKTNLHYFPILTCRKHDENDIRDGKFYVDYNNMICAGTKDSCQSDPGTPLQYCNEDVYCTYTITGIIARTNCNSDGVTIYTNIFNYLDWIEGIVWPEDI